jgi:hypothetical protein
MAYITNGNNKLLDHFIVRNLLLRAQGGIMISRNIAAFICLLMILFVTNCSKPRAQVVELKSFPVDNMEGIITQSGVQIDKRVSSDGKGSLQVTVSEPTVIRLYEVRDLNIENASLIYQAKVRTEGVEGQAYLEMWCHFPGKGEFFSRGLNNTLSGTNQWVTMETPFFLRKGESPDYVRLNLVINGEGTVWIDDIRLLKGQPAP